MDDLERQRELGRYRDETLNTPNCPTCLHRMEPVDVEGDPTWQCTQCRDTPAVADASRQ
ncbi:zf-TFIIB domain-containing protein [Cryobacterium sp. BB307]|uniref:TFIIB-type zinc ribbon-containing protein n=1 Tax=Cryobacterium sp. BB307 TaxID=2716317 RepID=UPI00144518A5|nr:zf-TFIIB domain-containing protein [Cryobacterium sp. BB307]